jgi:hypothetical protein
MPRARRWLLNSLTILSLLLFAAAVSLDFRSYTTRDIISDIQYSTLDDRAPFTDFTNSKVKFNGVSMAIMRMSMFSTQHGEILIYHNKHDVPFIPALPGWVRSSMSPSKGSDYQTIFVGFGWDFEPHAKLMLIPLWFIAALVAILPVRWLIQISRRKPLPGHCPHCGYDLRATPARCPECGDAQITHPTNPQDG